MLDPLQRHTRCDKIDSMAIDYGVQLISQDQISSLKQRAETSPRRRVNHNYHASLEENPHRFLNVMARGTYVAPHRHLSTPKPETFVVLEGNVALLTFDDEGRVEARWELGPESADRHWGIDLIPGIWHTLVVLTPTAVIFEVKPGPYVAAADKDFAPWAPREGDAGVAEYMAQLEAAAR